jgi:hypothetical protein
MKGWMMSGMGGTVERVASQGVLPKLGKMKRAPSEDLFKLIKSLNKGEKRNFKLLAGLLASEKDKKYIELFDVIDRQDVYNEAKILRLMKDLYGGQLAVGKHYLYRLILKSLVHYRNDAGSELGNLREQIRVLVEKDLCTQAHKLLRKGMAEAMALEDFTSLYVLLQLHVDLLVRNPHDKRLAEKLQEIAAEKVEVMARLQNLDAYRMLGQQMFLVTRSRHEARENHSPELVQYIESHPFLQDTGMARSNRALIEYHSIRRKLCSYHGDLKGAIAEAEQLLALYDANPLLKEEFIRQYFAEVSNLCTYLLRIGEKEAAFAKMEEFKLFRSAYPKARVDFFLLYYVVFIAAAIHNGEPERAVAIVQEIEVESAALEDKIPKSHGMWLHFLLASAFLMVGKPKSALHWVNKVLDENRSEVRVDLQCEARLLNMLIHFDLGNYSVVESEFQSTRRFLEKNGHFSEFERLVVRGAKALATHAGGPQYKEVLQGWMGRYQKWAAEEEAVAVRSIDFEAWLLSKTTGQTMAEIRRPKK